MTFGQWSTYWGPSALAQIVNSEEILAGCVNMGQPDAVWRLEAMLNEWDTAAAENTDDDLTAA